MPTTKALHMLAILLITEMIGATAFGMAQQLPSERTQVRAVRRTTVRRPVSHPMSVRPARTNEDDEIPMPRKRPNAANCDQQTPAAANQQHLNDVANAAAAGNLDANFMKRLNAVATANATKCRASAKSLHGGRVMCGNVSKGMCATGVRETLNTMGLPMGRGNAIDQRGWLRKNTQVVAEGSNLNANLCQKATPGVVCVYSTTRHSYGHIEIKTGENRFCSDYCSTHSAVLNPRGKFKLVGVYRLKQASK